ncbi:MAG TPA: hypothetical protein VFD71_21515, partial [Planctomycetota bacterium]|nr:hypothetical protein [Planctomycetota bacterium]
MARTARRPPPDSAPAARAGPASPEDHASIVQILRSRISDVRQGGPENARARHTQAGKLLVRDRIARLLDPGSPFLELSPL